MCSCLLGFDARFNFKQLVSPTDDYSSWVDEIFYALQTFGGSFVVQGDVYIRPVLVYLDVVDLERMLF